MTSNNGQSWSALTTNLPKDAAIRNLYADGANVFAVSPTEYDTLCTTGGFFFEGRCFGAPLPGLRSPIDYDLYFTTLGPGKIYYSPNQGQNWAPIGAGLNAAPMISVGGSGGAIFAGSNGYGVFSRRY